MLIDLKKCSKHEQEECVSIELNQRLPVQVIEPCTVTCSYKVQAIDNYFLINLKTSANLTIECQRCLTQFSEHYQHTSTIAGCTSEMDAERLMVNYECIITQDLVVDLVDLLTDELHLYSSMYHQKSADCDFSNLSLNQFINFSVNNDDKI